MNEIVEILSIPFIKTTKDAFVQQVIYPRIMKKVKTFVVTANPEIVEYADNHEEYKKILLSADYITPDGIGVVLASKWLRNPIEERIPGYDLMHDLFTLANQNSLKVYMLGAEETVIEKAVEQALQKNPQMNIVGYHHGYIDIEEQELAKSIAALEPDIILVALGYPLQEKWISLHKRLFKKGLFIGLGGSFDVLAGKVNRAPVIWRKLNLEWFYRLVMQPSRWRRMLLIPKFVVKVLKDKSKS